VDVARYYDGNTRRFLLVGRGRGAHAIHRELWAPGVTSAREAVDWVNRLVADEVEAVGPGFGPVVVDFGCGVGGTLFHLAERFPDADLHGVTVSPRQVAMAERLAERVGHAARCTFTLGDFHTAELPLRADAVVAVESFAHSTGADAFLANAARHLRPGGSLILVDDFLATAEESLEARQRLRVRQLRAGWRLSALCTAEALVVAADRHGLALRRSVDLTALTRPGSRVRDRVTAALSPLLARLGLGRVPFYGSLIGGRALQVGLRQGFLRYRMLVFERAR
jgi:SAM-dependent methyltransferase